MINKDDLYKQKATYLFNNENWKIVAYCPGPSVTMENITTGKLMDFGLGGELDKSFKEIKEETNGKPR